MRGPWNGQPQLVRPALVSGGAIRGALPDLLHRENLRSSHRQATRVCARLLSATRAQTSSRYRSAWSR